MSLAIFLFALAIFFIAIGLTLSKYGAHPEQETINQ